MIFLVSAVILLLVGGLVGYLYAVESMPTKTTTMVSTTTLMRSNESISRQTETTTSTYTVTSTITSQQIITSTVTSTGAGGGTIPVTSIEIANISIRGINAIAVNANASRVYVSGTSFMAVFDASSHSLLANISFPAKNLDAGLAIDYSTGLVYATTQSQVVEVNGSSNSIAGSLPFSFDTIAFDSSTHTLWGTQIRALNPAMHSNGSLVGVDARTGSIIANISVGFAPTGIAVDPRTGHVYSAGCSGSFVCGSEAVVVDGKTKTVLATISLPSAYYSTMTLNPTTNILYVGREATGSPERHERASGLPGGSPDMRPVHRHGSNSIF
jgi:DNA-binding beta-propeller fold protein YncE